MEYQAPKSKCNLCSSEFARAGMSRHLKSCISKNFQKQSKGKEKQLYYLHIHDAYNPDYFLHILITGSTKLSDLDDFLRHIWLECCGHMSAFKYSRQEGDISFSKKISDVFEPGTALEYMYDFGSTTELIIKNLEIYHGTTEKNRKIQIVSRNTQPLVPCDECGKKQAEVICTECQWDGKGWLCEECTEKHECGEDMHLPVVNSPRSGVCAYAG